MAQELDSVDRWEIQRESVELIPLVVEGYTSASGWSPTTNYFVTCVPVGTRPTSFAAPNSDGGLLGYLANGPTLAASSPGASFVVYTKIDGTTQDPVIAAATLKLL